MRPKVIKSSVDYSIDHGRIMLSKKDKILQPLEIKVWGKMLIQWNEVREAVYTIAYPYDLSYLPNTYKKVKELPNTWYSGL